MSGAEEAGGGGPAAGPAGAVPAGVGVGAGPGAAAGPAAAALGEAAGPGLPDEAGLAGARQLQEAAGDPDAPPKKRLRAAEAAEAAAAAVAAGSGKLEERLYSVLCCTVCLDLPKASVYQVGPPARHGAASPGGLGPVAGNPFQPRHPPNRPAKPRSRLEALAFSCSESHFPCSMVPFTSPSEFLLSSLDSLSAPSAFSRVSPLTYSSSYSADLAESCEQVPARHSYSSSTLPLTSRPPGGRSCLSGDRAPILAATPPQKILPCLSY